ncbi:MAG TPA: AraC family transcriptional regulator [Bacilli bacterium]
MNRIQWSEMLPVVNYANRLVCDSGFEFGPRTISDHQFIYIVKGKGTAEIQNRVYPARKGDLFYYGPGVIHKFTADLNDPYVLIGIHFQWKNELKGYQNFVHARETSSSHSFLHKPNEWLIEENGNAKLLLQDVQHLEDGETANVLQQIVSQYKAETIVSAAVNRALIVFLLHLIHKQISSHVFGPRKLLHDILIKLQASRSMPYNRGWLTEWSGYQQDYISRQFRQEFGLSPHSYHLQQKIELAKDKLEQERSSISSIAEQLHFGSVHYFCRAFKAHTGYSPMQYRQWKQRI